MDSQSAAYGSTQWSRHPITHVNRGYATFISLALLSAAFVISACGLVHRLAPEHRKRQNLRWLLIWFIKGLVLPVALIPQFFILQQLGLFDTRIGYILLWLSRMAFPVFVLTGFIKGIPSELDDAAAIDGCGYVRYVFQVIMPLLKPALGVVGLIVTIRVWNDIINPVIFLPSRAIKPVSAGLFQFYAENTAELTLIAAAIVITASPLILLFLFTQRYIVAGITGGALKG